MKEETLPVIPYNYESSQSNWVAFQSQHFSVDKKRQACCLSGFFFFFHCELGTSGLTKTLSFHWKPGCLCVLLESVSFSVLFFSITL